MNKNKTIGVVGAGIVGCSCALWLQKKGFSVTLIDPEIPGSGTSSGNACTIADYGCVPVNSPQVIKNLPSLLFARNSPLATDFTYALTHLPWMLSFLSNCRPSRVKKISNALGGLLRKTYDGLTPLINDCTAQSLMVSQGCMYLFSTESELDGARANHEVRRQHGTDFREINNNELRELEPGIKYPFQKALYFEKASQVINPQSLVTRYFETFMQNGGEYLPYRIDAISSQADGLLLKSTQGDDLRVSEVVIAAGAFSHQIDGIDARRLPLDTERGYHIQYQNQQSLLNRPVCWGSAGFYATPTDQGLRFAGTVEIAGYSDKKNPRNIRHLIEHSQQMFDLPPQPDQDWLGFRPTMPDSLPVIGRSPQDQRVVYAFGHQHIGLTLAGITGKIISEILNGETLCHDIEAFSPRRFL